MLQPFIHLAGNNALCICAKQTAGKRIQNNDRLSVKVFLILVCKISLRPFQTRFFSIRTATDQCKKQWCLFIVAFDAFFNGFLCKFRLIVDPCCKCNKTRCKPVTWSGNHQFLCCITDRIFLYNSNIICLQDSGCCTTYNIIMSIFLLQFLPDLYKSRFCLIKPVCSLLNTDKIMKFLCQTPNLIIDNLYVAVDCPYIGIQCLKIIVDRSKIVFNGSKIRLFNYSIRHLFSSCFQLHHFLQEINYKYLCFPDLFL